MSSSIKKMQKTLNIKGILKTGASTFESSLRKCSIYIHLQSTKHDWLTQMPVILAAMAQGANDECWFGRSCSDEA